MTEVFVRLPDVLINGERYVPAREAKISVREAVARVLAEDFWGGLKAGPDWEADFRDKMSEVYFNSNEDGDGSSAFDLVDRVVQKLAESGVADKSSEVK